MTAWLQTLIPILLFLGASGLATLANAAPWRVVILPGADISQPAAAQLLQGLREELKAQAPNGVEIFVDPLDGLRFDSRTLTPPYVEFLKRKYERQPVDLVIGLADIALDFTERYHDTIWPGVPVLISSIEADGLRHRTLPARFTYLPFQVDIEGTLRLVATLQPSLQRLIVVTGSMPVDQSWPSRVQAIAERTLHRKWAIEVWSGLTQAELVQQATRLGANTAIIYTTMYRDRSGSAYFPVDVVKPLSDAARVPVYGWYGTYLEHGLAGGSMVDFYGHGRHTAAIAGILLGKTMAGLAGVLSAEPPRCAANVGKMMALGMDTSLLPANCDVVNTPPSIWRDHRQLVLVVCSLLVLQAGTISGLLWQRRRRRLAEEEAARRRNELTRSARIASIGEMGAAIAHEISQPLGAIVNNADAARLMLCNYPADAAPDMSEIRQIVDDVQRDAVRASRILTRQRALMSKHEPALVPMYPDGALDEALAMLAPEIRRRGCSLRMDLNGGESHVMADRIQLQQVLLNLVINAMDAMQSLPANQRRVTVTSSTSADWYVMTVADSGPGILADVLPQIFDSFYTTKEGGTGLGLPIVRAIVGVHGGKLKVDTSIPDGTVFEVRLPRIRRRIASSHSRKDRLRDLTVTRPIP